MISETDKGKLNRDQRPRKIGTVDPEFRLQYFQDENLTKPAPEDSGQQAYSSVTSPNNPSNRQELRKGEINSS